MSFVSGLEFETFYMTSYTDTDSPSLLRKKYLSTNSKYNMMVQCPSCLKNYKNCFVLKRHQKYECGVERQFRCHICHKRFKHNFHLARHMSSVHKQESEETNN